VRDSGQLALWLGLLTAVVALTAAVGQVERGANRNAIRLRASAACAR
jgi:hypothetical protein